MPRAAAETLYALTGLSFLADNGMTETIAPTTANPAHAVKIQCGDAPIQRYERLIFIRLTPPNNGLA